MPKERDLASLSLLRFKQRLKIVNRSRSQCSEWLVRYTIKLMSSILQSLER